jgi:hypothetical protein
VFNTLAMPCTPQTPRLLVHPHERKCLRTLCRTRWWVGSPAQWKGSTACAECNDAIVSRTRRLAHASLIEMAKCLAMPRSVCAAAKSKGKARPRIWQQPVR